MGTKISALPAGAALTGFEAIPAVQSLADVQITANQIKTFVLAALATVATSGNAADLVGGTLAAARLPAFAGGDVTSASGSASLAIGANKVTRSMLAQTSGSVFLGSPVAGNVSDLTPAQAKTLLAITSADVAPLGSTQTASYQLVATDANTMVRMNSASGVNVTVPAGIFPLWTEIAVAQAGAGTVTFVAGSSVTINSRGGLVSLAGQYAAATLKQVATNVWLLIGDLA